MLETTNLPTSLRAVSPEFCTTHWSVVLGAREQDSPKAADALAALCRTYWYPLYVFVRRKGHSPHDTQDLTQEISDLSKTNWTDVPGALTLNFTNLQYQMTLPLAVIDRFYRLKH